MSRKLDRLRALLAAEIAARPVLHRVVFVGVQRDQDQCGGYVCRERGAVAEAVIIEANASCGQPHPHPLRAPRGRRQRPRYGRVPTVSST